MISLAAGAALVLAFISRRKACGPRAAAVSMAEDGLRELNASTSAAPAASEITTSVLPQPSDCERTRPKTRPNNPVDREREPGEVKVLDPIRSSP